MSEASGLSENLRTLADFVDRLEDAAKIDVEDARFLDLDGEDELRASLTVRAPIAPAPEDVVDLAEVRGQRDVQDYADEDDQDGAVDEPEDEDEDEDEDDEVWCAKCGFGPSSEVGVARHNGAVHGGDAEITTDPDDLPDVDESEDEDEGGELEPTPEQVFAELRQMVDNGHNWVKARQLADRFDVTGQMIGQRLRVLRDDDHVEKNRDYATVAVWRPVPTEEQQEADQDEDDSDHSTEDDELSEAPDVDLEESDADDAPEDTGDDVQDESVDVAEEKPTVDGVDYDADTEVDLPDGITARLVDELTSGGIKLGDLAEELDVHPNRARAIAFDLGYYSRVREVKYRGGRAQITPLQKALLTMVVGAVLLACAVVVEVGL